MENKQYFELVPVSVKPERESTYTVIDKYGSSLTLIWMNECWRYLNRKPILDLENLLNYYRPVSLAGQEENRVGEDMICPVTKKHCDDECCPVGAICNLSNSEGIARRSLAPQPAGQEEKYSWQDVEQAFVKAWATRSSEPLSKLLQDYSDAYRFKPASLPAAGQSAGAIPELLLNALNNWEVAHKEFNDGYRNVNGTITRLNIAVLSANCNQADTSLRKAFHATKSESIQPGSGEGKMFGVKDVMEAWDAGFIIGTRKQTTAMDKLDRNKYLSILASTHKAAPDTSDLALSLWDRYCTLFTSSDESLQLEFAGKYIMEKHSFLAAVEEVVEKLRL